MIEVNQLCLSAGSFLLDNVTFSVAAGQYAVLMGKTGCGKTTLVEGLCGLRPARAGQVRLLGRDVTRLKPAERGIGFVPQDRALFPGMSVWDHLAFAMVVRRWDKRVISERVGELADLLGLGRLLDRVPAGLSGGEAQRVALGRALAAQPQVLLLDEPLSALDEPTRLDMCRLLATLRERTGVTTIHVTHNLHEARQLADRLFLLRDGVLQESGLDGLHQPQPIPSAGGRS